MYLNPALAGQDGDMLLSTNYRTQWKSINAPYTSSQVTGAYPFISKTKIDRHLGGIAASFYNDRSGDAILKTNAFSLSGAYNLPIDAAHQNMISFGIQASLVQKSVDLDNAQWGSQYIPGVGVDPSKPADQASVSSNRLFPVVNAGLIWYYGNRNFEFSKLRSFLGVSVYNINTPNQSLVEGQTSKLDRLYRVHWGFEVKASEKINISPNFLVAYQGASQQYNGGMYISYLVVSKTTGFFAETRLMAGGWYRLGDAAIAMAGLSTAWYQLGFSYDMNTSNLKTYSKSKGAYELSLILRKHKTTELKRYSTPRF